MKFLHIRKMFLLILVMMTGIEAAVLKVPEDYSTIQAAINASADGDTVLVASGTYVENINFRGKNIMVSSYYLFDEDVSFIANTIIDGSQPVNPDTASCVLIISGEDSTAVLQGFTLTGGTGTKWIDEHGAGTYVEGGGILTALSSPTIKNNYITNNSANRTGTGVTSAGGGGIRSGDGNPTIINNVITYNSAMYGGGIVLNYTGAVVRNNIIYNNHVAQFVAGAPTFGGGGIWINSSLGSLVKKIENNTITGNTSAGTLSNAAGKGGGILIWSTSIEARNNIVWGNTQTIAGQIIQIGGTSSITYNLVEGGWTGTGNIDADPEFEETAFYLQDNSPAIDAGDPDAVYNDPEGNPGSALFPSKGTVRNDIGAYGGPGAKELSEFVTSVYDDQSGLSPDDFELLDNYPNPFNPSTKIKFVVAQSSKVSLKVFDITGKEVATLLNGEIDAGSHELAFNSGGLASGVYFYRLSAGKYNQTKKMILLR